MPLSHRYQRHRRGPAWRPGHQAGPRPADPPGHRGGTLPGPPGHRRPFRLALAPGTDRDGAAQDQRLHRALRLVPAVLPAGTGARDRRTAPGSHPLRQRLPVYQVGPGPGGARCPLPQARGQGEDPARERRPTSQAGTSLEPRYTGTVHALPLASEPLGFFGALIVIIISLLFLGVFIAATFGPIALVIAAIVKSFRNSAANTSPGVSASAMTFTMSSGTRVVALDPASPFAQAFGASLQRGLGGQLGQTLAQMMTLAAAQHPLELQLAPMVMAIEAARRQGHGTPVRPFLSD